MKKSEQAMIIFIALISVMVAYAIGNAVFGKATAEGTSVKTAQKISSSVEAPDNSSPIFNSNNINPAVQIQIAAPTPTGDSTNGQ